MNEDIKDRICPLLSAGADMNWSSNHKRYCVGLKCAWHIVVNKIVMCPINVAMIKLLNFGSWPDVEGGEDDNT